MKFITILLTVLALESCGNTKAATNFQDDMVTKQTETLSGKYLISSFKDNNKLPSDTHLIFDESTNIVSGYAGCNRFSTDYKIKGNSIKFGSFLSTKMYCENLVDIEQSLQKTLKKTSTFSIENNVLTLMNKKGNHIVSANKKTVARIAQDEKYSIEYSAITRGTYFNVVVKDNSITFQKELSAKPQTRKFKPEEITSIYGKMENLDLNTLSNLEPPSKAHQYDGAAGATFKITKDGITYQTKTFDHGKPNAEIAELVNTVLSMTEKKQ